MTNKVFNGSSNNWNTASAWTPTGIPVNGDSVSFATGSTMGVNPTTPVSLYNFDDSNSVYGTRTIWASAGSTLITVTGSLTIGLAVTSSRIYTNFNFTGDLFGVNIYSTFDNCIFNACVIYAHPIENYLVTTETSFCVTNSLIENSALVVFGDGLGSVRDNTNPVIGSITGPNKGLFRQTGGSVGVSSGFAGSATDQFFNAFGSAVNYGNFPDMNTAAAAFEGLLESFYASNTIPANVVSWGYTAVTGTGPSGGSSSGPTAADIATAVAAAVLATPGNLLATDVTGAVLENHGQAGAYGNPVMTVTVTLNGSANPLITWTPTPGANRYIVSKTTSNGVVNIGTVTAPATLLIDTTGPVAGAKYAVIPAY